MPVLGSQTLSYSSKGGLGAQQANLGRKQAKNLLMSEQPPKMVEGTEEERLESVSFAKG